MTRADSELFTPERVRSAAFTSTRLGRRGVDEAEVSAFCAWISDGLGRLLNDNGMLQAEVHRLRSRLLEGKGQNGISPKTCTCRRSTCCRRPSRRPTAT